mgnify:CR=1 FL=1
MKRKKISVSTPTSKYYPQYYSQKEGQTGVQFETEGIFLSFKVSFSEKLLTENTCTGDASKDADIKYEK